MALAAVVLGIACFTRYEAWIACPILAWLYASRGHWERRKILTGIAMFCWAPAVWILCHFGFSSPGTYVIEIPHSPARLIRWMYLGWISIRHSPLPVVIFTLAGAIVLIRRRSDDKAEVMPFAAFVVLFLMAILLSAQGEPHSSLPNSEAFVTSREAALPVAFLLLLAAAGLQVLLQSASWRRAAWLIAAAGVILGIVQSMYFVHEQAAAPDPALSYRLAQYLSRHVKAGERVLVLAKPFSDSDWSPYINHARRLQGSEGAARAYRNLRSIDLSPLEFQRTAIQTQLSPKQLLPTGDAASMDWVAVWNNAPGPPVLPAGFRLAADFTVDNRSVKIWRRSQPAVGHRSLLGENDTKKVNDEARSQERGHL
jgi:hypothetical protein